MEAEFFSMRIDRQETNNRFSQFCETAYVTDVPLALHLVTKSPAINWYGPLADLDAGRKKKNPTLSPGIRIPMPVLQ